MVSRVLYTQEGKTFFVKDSSRDYHTTFGYIKKEDLTKPKQVKTNKGKELFVVKPSFIDYYKKIKRGAQIIIPKDVGLIIAECHINNILRPFLL